MVAPVDHHPERRHRPWVVAALVLLFAVTAAELASGQEPAGGSRDPRTDAKRILEGDRYQPSRAPQPFRGLLQWIADRLEPIGRAVDWVFRDRARAAVVLVLMATMAATIAARLVRGRNRSAVARLDRAHRRRQHIDPDELERAAERAEQAGDLAAAIRLRFRAGLVRLDQARAPVRTGAPSAELSRGLGSPAFDEVATDFDEVVYGGRPAAAVDVERARRNWPIVLHDAGQAAGRE